MSDKRNEGRDEGRPPGGRSGADWQTAGQAPFDERGGPMTTPRPQQSGDKPADKSTAGKSTAGKSTAGKSTECDDTQFGQAAGAPGGRGGTTPYGGVERVKPRTER